MRVIVAVPLLALLALLALPLGGCSGCPAGPRTLDAAPPAAADGGAPAGRDQSGDGGTDVRPSDGGPGASRVFFLRFAGELLPFGCWDARQGAFDRGDGCSDLVAAAPTVRVLSDRGGRLRAERVQVVPAKIPFPVLDLVADGFRFARRCPNPEDRSGAAPNPCAGPDGPAGDHAVWPPGYAGLRLAGTIPPPQIDRGAPASDGGLPASDGGLPARDGGAADVRGARRSRGREAPGPVLAAIAAALAKSGFSAAPPTWLHQRLSVDLDGDGKDERLLVFQVSTDAVDLEGLVSEEDGSELPSTLFYMFVDRGAGRFERIRIPAEDVTLGHDADAEVLGTIDLDGDGAVELWVRSEYFEGRNTLLGRWAGGVWRTIAAFTEGT